MHNATPDSMAALQMDAKSLPAQLFLPDMLAGLEKAGMPNAEQEVVEMLRSWNLRYDSDQTAPSVFDAWFGALQDTVWDELKANNYPYPKHQQLAQVLHGGALAHSFLDVQATPQLETVNILYRASFQKAYNQLIENHGAAGKAWNWGRVKRTNVTHMARIPGLSVPFVSVSGGKYEGNATSQTHGPSMRMVVSLKPPVQAFGNMPGGQSGNPGSPYFLTELAAWKTGKLLPWAEFSANSKTNPKLMAIWNFNKP
jgi:penicillin amidase